MLLGQTLLLTQPAHGAIETTLSFFAVSQPMVRHRQEEQVEGVRLAAAGGQAALQGGDSLAVPACAVQDDTQRVQGGGLAGRQVHGSPAQRHRAVPIAPRLGTIRQLPGSVVAALGELFSDKVLVGLERQRGLQVGDRGIELVQVEVDRPADGPIVGVVGPQSNRTRQGVDRLREAAQVDQRMSAMVVGVGIVRIVLESGGVALEQRCGGSVNCSRCSASGP